jgi:hypothetical protein
VLRSCLARLTHAGPQGAEFSSNPSRPRASGGGVDQAIDLVEPFVELVGGFVLARPAVATDRWKLWRLRSHQVLAGPVFALRMLMLTSDFTTIVAAPVATSLLVGFHLGPFSAIAWTVAKPSMRAQARWRSAAMR